MNPIFNQSSYSSVLYKYIVLSLLCLMANLALTTDTNASITQLNASVDRNVALLDESFQLTVTASGTAARDSVDFSRLQTNFRVSPPSFSQSTQIINGSMSRTVTWTLSLYPKQTGTFVIPRFTADGQSSREFQVKVLPVDTNNNNRPREFYVTASTNDVPTYLQQQISYVVKIHLSSDIQRGQLSLPELEGAIIEQIGEDADSQEIIDGVRYRVIERTYAIIPQASGTFTIKGPIFEAEVATNSRRSFANFGRTKKITRSAPDIPITVRPIPSNYTDTWLPSELVEITEQWQGNTEPFVVGEPVTRTITLTAFGLTKEQLPTISLPYHPSFKVYPEQPTLATVQRNNKLIAQGVFNSAIIPEYAGDFILPEARIPWFDVNSGETKYAVLPARTVQVIAATGTPVTQTTNNQQADENEQKAAETGQLLAPEQGLNWIHYLLISTNVFTLIALFVVIVGRNNKANTAPVTIQPLIEKSEETAFKQLKQLLEQGKLNDVSHALESWLTLLLGSQYYSISASLAADPSTNALDEYNKILGNHFSGRNDSIDIVQFINSLEQIRTLNDSTSQQTPLNNLYPS